MAKLYVIELDRLPSPEFRLLVGGQEIERARVVDNRFMEVLST
jgi:hypothetical protein